MASLVSSPKNSTVGGSSPDHGPAGPTEQQQGLSTQGKDKEMKTAGGMLNQILHFGGIRFMVLMILCLQNSMFTVLRRYSLGVLKEEYSKVREQ